MVSRIERYAVSPFTHPLTLPPSIWSPWPSHALLFTVSFANRDGAVATAESDRFGAFVAASSPAGAAVRIEVEAYGYQSWSRDYDELPRGEILVLLRPAPVALDSLVVNTRGQPGNPISVSWDAFVVDTAVMRMLPTVLETDALRAVSMSPSASAPSDWTAIPYVRRRASAGTPVMLDGVRLFNPHHLGGFLSALNAEAVQRVTLLPGSGGESSALWVAVGRDRHTDPRRGTGPTARYGLPGPGFVEGCARGPNR